MDAKPRVAILTTFMGLPSGYGLVPVVLNQLRMLQENGYNPHLFTQERYNKKELEEKLPEGVVHKPLVPFMHLVEYGPMMERQKFDVPAEGVLEGGKAKTNFDAQVKRLVDGLEAPLSEYDVVITHDIVFQTWFVVHNAAILEIAKKNTDLRWIHWLHSGPSPRPANMVYPGSLRFCGMPNSVYVSPNESMTSKFAEMYNIPKKWIKVVYNTIDINKFYDLHPLSIELIKKHQLLDCDILCVWATRIDHYRGKGLAWPVRFVAQLNKIVEAKMLFCNSWSRGENAKNNMRLMRRQADEWGLPQDYLIFTSEMGSEWENGVPQKVVRDMYWIGNLFIMPSISETFSLAMAEAAACKNFLVLNEDLTVFHELAGDDAEYVGFGAHWGGQRIERDYKPNAEQFLMDRARELVEKFRATKPLQMHRKVLRRFNREWVFKNQLEPLILGENRSG